MTSPAQILAQQLATFGTSGSFATRFTVEADPQLNVEGVGEVQLPINIHTAHQLCAVARPASHGYKDETRLDPRVRDTWEIPAKSLRFAAPQWPEVLDRALTRISYDLGLPSGITLEAELHNLLVYAPGQFFAVHQDSEKTDGMLGTLVVTLPSTFTGGEFVISHQGQTLRTRDSAGKLGMVAFYADCHHEVRPVKQGYRVVLTWNLIARGDTPVADLAEQDLVALADAVRNFWLTPPPPRWRSDTGRTPPERLVYLLDHQYTPAGLSWTHLKGADAQRATALRRVAERLDAEIFLALADVHEIWSAENDYRTAGRWEEVDDENEDDGEDGSNTGDPVLSELIDSEIELRHAIAPDGSRLAAETDFAAEAELCMNRLSVDCAPFRSEYEGYMGNEGNTVDRWYHRAAVVMWPRERAFTIRARQSPRWGIEQIAERLGAGDSVQASQWVQSMLPFWTRSVARDEHLFADTLAVTAALDDASAAAALLVPFALSQLTPDMAAQMLQLLERHGLDWCQERLQQWAKAPLGDENQLHWMTHSLPSLVDAWSTAASEEVRALVAALLADCSAWLRERHANIQRYDGGNARQKALEASSPVLLALIRCSHVAGLTALRQQLVGSLHSGELPLQVSLAVLRAADTDTISTQVLAPILAPVHAFCTQALAAALMRAERADDDWSIQWPEGDSRLGELSDILQRFLASPVQRRLAWPLAKARRQLVHQFIDRHELPVLHQTQRIGRPFTLMLEKTSALFEREAAKRRQCASGLDWLRQTASRFSQSRAEER